MNTPRYLHTATLLPSGKVLVAGGDDDPTLGLASAELYDPTTGIWAYTGNLNAGRAAQTATLLPNGKVLVVGGRDVNIAPLASAELYDPATGIWSSTGNMNARRGEGHTVTLLPNGEVLVAGGACAPPAGGTCPPVLRAAELYDPATGTWSATGSMSTPRYFHTARLLPSGYVLVAGGFNSDDLASAELYDPATGTWSDTASMVTPRAGPPFDSSLLAGGKVLVAGGQTTGGTFTATAELYDPATGTWSTTGSMSTPRGNITLTLLPTGKVLAAGGSSYAYWATAELFDPAMGTWSTTGSMSTARSTHTTTLLAGGEVLVAGGWNFNVVASAEIYGLDPPTPTPLPSPVVTPSPTPIPPPGPPVAVGGIVGLIESPQRAPAAGENGPGVSGGILGLSWYALATGTVFLFVAAAAGSKAGLALGGWAYETYYFLTRRQRRP